MVWVLGILLGLTVGFIVLLLSIAFRIAGSYQTD